MKHPIRMLSLQFVKISADVIDVTGYLKTGEKNCLY